MSKTKIMFADPSELFRKAIGSLLNTKFNITGEVTTGQELLEQLSDNGAQAVLLGSSLLAESGAELPDKIKMLFPLVKIIVLSAQAEHTIPEDIILNKSIHYIDRYCEVGKLFELISSVTDERFISPS